MQYCNRYECMMSDMCNVCNKTVLWSQFFNVYLTYKLNCQKYSTKLVRCKIIKMLTKCLDIKHLRRLEADMTRVSLSEVHIFSNNKNDQLFVQSMLKNITEYFYSRLHNSSFYKTVFTGNLNL